MTYIVTGESKDVRGALSWSANDKTEALMKAHKILDTGLVNVSIRDDRGEKISGDDLLVLLGRNKTTN